ncbi:MAG: nucleotide pyrophosphohydrolase [Pirellulales bacterium]|nr:nucleotide pyrophosphohydrolase [Pirellulales bacterium]
MNDDDTRVAELRALVREFVDQRNWRQFHTPKNISMALAIEAAELMEHFQWLEPAESRAVAAQPEKLSAVAEELADVLCYALALANELGIDVARAMSEKMVKNRRKYPVEEFRGRYGPEDVREPN